MWMTPENRNCYMNESENACRMIVLALPPVPAEEDTLESQMAAALEEIRACLERAQRDDSHGGGKWVVTQQTIFIRDYAWRHECQQMMREFYGAEMPVNVYVPQPPCEGQMVAVEAVAIYNESSDENFVEFVSEDAVITRHGGVCWYFCRQQDPGDLSANIYSQSLDSFQKLDKTYASLGVPFQNVVRTWLYLGNITEPTFNVQVGDTQRYKELNRARSDFFREISFFDGMLPEGYQGPKYPASTGIGGVDDCVVISALGVTYTDEDHVKVVPLENPQQVPASAYGEEYSPKSPKFARAMAVSAEEADGTKTGAIFVSGTASITDAESRYDGDPVLQTELTLDNIRVLIAEENLSRHGMPGLGCGLNEMAAVRVYVKFERDYEAVRGVCERLMPDVAKLYTFSDVCRPELLVEIEGVAFTREK